MARISRIIPVAMGLVMTAGLDGGAMAQNMQLPGALQSDVRTLKDDLGDANCTEPVDAFKIEANFGRILTDVAAHAGLKLLTGDLSSAQSAALTQLRETAKGLNWLPMPIEEQMGEIKNQQLQDSGDPNYTILDRDSNAEKWEVANSVFDKIIAALPPDQPYHFKLVVTNRPNPGSAFALPGGYIYVPAGSVPDPVDKKNFEKQKQLLTFTLAHEVAHVLKRHETRQLQAQMLNAITKMEQLYDLARLLDNGSKSAAITKQITLLIHPGAQYDVPQEKQADGCSLRAMLVNHEQAELGLLAFLELTKTESDKPAETGDSLANPTTPAAPEDHGGIDGAFKSVIKAGGGVLGSFGSVFGSSSETTSPAPPPTTGKTSNDGSHPSYPERLDNGRAVIAFWKSHNPAPFQSYKLPTKTP